MKLRHLAAAFVLALPVLASAQELFDTAEYDGPMLSFGARMGVNTSTVTYTPYGHNYAINQWGTGFDLGAVVDIHVRDYLAIQPGLFFQSRSGNYSYFYDNELSDALPNGSFGHRRRTLMQVPVVASLRLHPMDRILWSVDLGPEFNFGLGGSDDNHTVNLMGQQNHKIGYYDEYNRFMMGLKMGTGVTLWEHYYLGVHYECGLRSSRKYDGGGRDHCWTFTIGYDLQ